jgi:molecular chaperone Hsp33
MLPESRLYSFIDQKEGFTVHFLEGQKLIQDLAVIHSVQGEGFQYFRNAILSIQPMISFLKPEEGLGVYLDSDEPYFRLKIEMSEAGQMRTLLLPESFKQFPEAITGKCRVVKSFPNDSNPYTSVIKLDHINFEQVINNILRDSYQIRSEVFLNELTDQSLMIMKLPEININKIQTNYTLNVEEYFKKISADLESLYQKQTTDYETIQKHFENIGLIYLGSKEVSFKCTCSRDRMYQGLKSLINSSDINHVFEPHEKSIETTCDYCKTSYLFMRDEF